MPIVNMQSVIDGSVDASCPRVLLVYSNTTKSRQADVVL
jgi:hypothetical protein